MHTWRKLLVAAASSFVIAACSDNDGSPSGFAPTACNVDDLAGETVFLTFFNDGKAIAFASGGLDESRTLAEVAEDEVVAVNVTGLAANEFVIGADFNPANDELIAVTNLGAFYRGPLSGTCGGENEPGTTALALTPLPGPDGTTPFTTTPADRISISFNPTVNAFRIVKGDSTNLRAVLNTDGTGLRPLQFDGVPTLPSNPVVDSALVYDAGDENAGENVFAVDLAYTNQMLDGTGARPSATEVFVYDINLPRLVYAQLGGPNASEGNPNLGRLVTIFNDDEIEEESMFTSFLDIDPERNNLAVGIDANQFCTLVYDFTFASGADDFVDRGQLFCDNNQALLGVTAGASPSAFTVVPKAAIENLEFNQ